MIFVWGIAILALALFFISSIKKGQSILGFNKFLASQSVNDLYSTFTMESEKLDDIRVSLISESLEIEKATTKVSCIALTKMASNILSSAITALQ